MIATLLSSLPMRCPPVDDVFAAFSRFRRALASG